MDVKTVEAYLNDRHGSQAPDIDLTAEGLDFGALFDENAAALYRTILAYTGGRSDVAEEAVGEAFARVVAHGERLRDPVAWLYRVAFNVANDELRRDRRRSRTAIPDVAQPPQEASDLFDALEELPPQQRAALVLFYVRDLPVAEVAARMGVAAPTVRVHLMKGRRHLRALLGEGEEIR